MCHGEIFYIMVKALHMHYERMIFNHILELKIIITKVKYG